MSSSPELYDSAYESLYSAFTSSSGTISSNSNTSSSSTSCSTCMTSDTLSNGKFHSIPLMDPLTLNTVDDLPNSNSIGSSRNLSSIRLEPISMTKQKLISNENVKKQIKSKHLIDSMENCKNSRFTCHRKSYPMSMSKQEQEQKSSRPDLLPPLESIDSSTSDKTLPFKEYKKWLSNFRNRSTTGSKSSSSSSNCASFDDTFNQSKCSQVPKVRCQTATIRLRRESDPLFDRKMIEEKSINKTTQNNLNSNKLNNSSDRIFTISDKSYLNSGKNDHLNESNGFINSSKVVINGKQGKYHQRKSSIVTMNCYDTDLIHSNSTTVFDLNALNDALTKPRNKVAPTSVSLLSVNHLKSTSNIF